MIEGGPMDPNVYGHMLELFGDPPRLELCDTPTIIEADDGKCDIGFPISAPDGLQSDVTIRMSAAIFFSCLRF